MSLLHDTLFVLSVCGVTILNVRIPFRVLPSSIDFFEDFRQWSPHNRVTYSWESFELWRSRAAVATQCLCVSITWKFFLECNH